MGGQAGFAEHTFDQHQEAGIADGAGGDVDADKRLRVGAVVTPTADVAAGLLEHEGRERQPSVRCSRHGR